MVELATLKLTAIVMDLVIVDGLGHKDITGTTQMLIVFAGDDKDKEQRHRKQSEKRIKLISYPMLKYLFNELI